MLFGGCSGTTQVLIRPDPPLPDLTEPCDAGPSVPTTAIRFEDLAKLVRAREKAARICAAKHKALASWAATVSSAPSP